MWLTAQGLGFGYPDHQVLRSVDIEVSSGESLAITGPSGSGKTTLLALLGGLLTPQSGRLVVRSAGAHESSAPQVPLGRDLVAWVLQTINVLNDRTVLDNAAAGAFMSGATRAEASARAREALADVGLGPRAGDAVRRLSGGETQRVVVARALASDAPFILADEPTGQLDATNTQIVLDALLLTTRTRGLVVVTHDPAVASRCDRIATLRDGVLIQA